MSVLTVIIVFVQIKSGRLGFLTCKETTVGGGGFGGDNEFVFIVCVSLE